MLKTSSVKKDVFLANSEGMADESNKESIDKESLLTASPKTAIIALRSLREVVSFNEILIV